MTDTQPTPTWAAKYRQFAAWTHDEFRNLLCGLPPHALDDAPVPGDTPAPTLKEINDAFVRDEMRRLDADRHVQDAILTGELEVLGPDDQLLDRIQPVVDAKDFEMLRHAVAHDRTCSKSNHVARDVAVRWAASRRELFPNFPFNREDASAAAPARSIEDLMDGPRSRQRELTAFATNVERHRKNEGWTIATLAEKIQMDESTVKDHVGGKSMPHPANLKKYADAFRVTVADLLA